MSQDYKAAKPSGSAETGPQKKYFPSIDGLRLIASINVVLFHLERAGALDHLQGSPGWLFVFLKGPMFHASLFFILGGFIYGAKFAGREHAFRTRGFFLKRLGTLYPLHLATTLLMVALIVLTDSIIDLPRLLFSVFWHLSGLWAFWPQKAYMLNSPAWALSAFFLCYLLLGPLLRLTARLTTSRALLLAMGCAMIPIVAWSGLYFTLGNHALYQQFHVFAPVRFFEFVLGVLLARLYQRNPGKSFVPPFINDLIVVTVTVGVFFIARLELQVGDQAKFILYHSGMVPLYAVLVYRMARGGGLFAFLFALKPVRSLGMCSFYPYLLHIPLSSLTCFVAWRMVGVDGLFHEPLPLIVFMAVLYTGSALVWGRLRTGRSASGPDRPK